MGSKTQRFSNVDRIHPIKGSVRTIRTRTVRHSFMHWSVSIFNFYSCRTIRVMPLCLYYCVSDVSSGSLFTKNTVRFTEIRLFQLMIEEYQTTFSIDNGGQPQHQQQMPGVSSRNCI